MICTKEGFSKSSLFTAEATQSMEQLVEALAVAAADSTSDYTHTPLFHCFVVRTDCI